jgi:hypothetical protein
MFAQVCGVRDDEGMTSRHRCARGADPRARLSAPRLDGLQEELAVLGAVVWDERGGSALRGEWERVLVPTADPAAAMALYVRARGEGGEGGLNEAQFPHRCVIPSPAAVESAGPGAVRYLYRFDLVRNQETSWGMAK